jgi:hypothetical protein
MAVALAVVLTTAARSDHELDPSQDGWTALHEAAFSGWREAAHLLLQAGANKEACTLVRGVRQCGQPDDAAGVLAARPATMPWPNAGPAAAAEVGPQGAGGAGGGQQQRPGAHGRVRPRPGEQALGAGRLLGAPLQLGPRGHLPALPAARPARQQPATCPPRPGPNSAPALRHRWAGRRCTSPRATSARRWWRTCCSAAAASRRSPGWAGGVGGWGGCLPSPVCAAQRRSCSHSSTARCCAAAAATGRPLNQEHLWKGADRGVGGGGRPGREAGSCSGGSDALRPCACWRAARLDAAARRRLQRQRRVGEAAAGEGRQRQRLHQGEQALGSAGRGWAGAARTSHYASCLPAAASRGAWAAGPALPDA